MTVLSTNLQLANATTQFTNYDFNSMVNFNGKQIVANATGLYELGTDTDEGVNIDAFFEPVTSDFGDSHPKHIRFAYLGFEADGNIRLTVIDDRGHSEIKDIIAQFIGQQRSRTTITRALTGRYWTFNIANVNGAYFALDSLEILPIRRSHGIHQQR